MKIIVEEEFGYKYYMWTAPFSTAEDLINWWNRLKPSMITDIVFPTARETGTDLYQNTFGGRWLLCDADDIHGPGDGHMHIHTPEDSYLEIGGGRYFVKLENNDEYSTIS